MAKPHLLGSMLGDVKSSWKTTVDRRCKNLGEIGGGSLDLLIFSVKKLLSKSQTKFYQYFDNKKHVKNVNTTIWLKSIL